jgi:hypothetical protein
VSSPLVTKRCPKRLAARLKEATGYETAVAVLKDAMIYAGSRQYSFGDEDCVRYFNHRLTKRVNSFIKKQLGLDISINSFMENVVELVAYIEKKYGQAFSNPLRVYQMQVINSVADYVDESSEISLNSFYCPQEFEDKPFITYFSTPDLFLALNMYTVDLKFTIPKVNVSVAVFEDQVPLISALAKYVFETEEKMGSSFNRRLIKTLDDDVFELNRSCLDRNTLLITKM